MYAPHNRKTQSHNIEFREDFWMKLCNGGKEQKST